MIDFLSNTSNTGIILVLIGSFYIVLGHIFGSGKKIYKRTSGDIDDMSTDLFVYLDRQRIEGISGFALILLGSIFQLIDFDFQQYSFITILLGLLLPLVIIISKNERRMENIKILDNDKEAVKKKPWFINYFIDTLGHLSNVLKNNTRLDLYYWIFLLLFCLGTIYYYLYRAAEGMLTNYILWMTFIAILWYSKETYWLKQVQQKNLNHERKKDKLKLINQLVGNRNDLSGEKFSEAINQINIIFADDKNLIKELLDLHTLLEKNPVVNDEVNKNLLKILELMYRNLKIDFQETDKQAFLKVFNKKS